MDSAYTPVQRMVRADLQKSKQAKGIGWEHSERHLLTHTLRCTSEHPQKYSVRTWLCGTHGGAVGQRRHTLQTRRLDLNLTTSESRCGCPIQEDLCRHAQGRRPQFRLLAAKYSLSRRCAHRCGQGTLWLAVTLIKYWWVKKKPFDCIGNNVGYAAKCDIAPLFAC